MVNCTLNKIYLAIESFLYFLRALKYNFEVQTVSTNQLIDVYFISPLSFTKNILSDITSRKPKMKPVIKKFRENLETKVFRTVLIYKKLLLQYLECSNKTKFASSLVLSLFVWDHRLRLLQDRIENWLCISDMLSTKNSFE